MKIVSCGDSFFYGTDLKDCIQSHVWQPSQSTWPALIAKKLNYRYNCQAHGGHGNLHILQQIINAVSQHKNQAIYFINWSWSDRFDYIQTETNEWATVRPGLDDSVRDPLYYKYFHSELGDKFTSLVYINQAISLLKEHQCKFIMTYMDKLVLDQQWHAPEYVKLLQQQARKYLKDFDGHTFLEWSRINQYPESAGWHPMEPAHHAAAEFWFPKIKELL
jgi:hypothetical protein